MEYVVIALQRLSILRIQDSQDQVVQIFLGNCHLTLLQSLKQLISVLKVILALKTIPLKHIPFSIGLKWGDSAGQSKRNVSLWQFLKWHSHAISLNLILY